MIQVSGTGVAQVDTEHHILSVSADGKSFTIEVKDVNNNLPTSGVETKIAPLGWEGIYTDTNKRVYKTTSTEYNNYYYFVDNTCPATYDTNWAKYARVGIGEGWAGEMNPAGLTIPSDWNSWKPSGTGNTMNMGHGKIFYNATYEVTATVYPTYGSVAGNATWFIFGTESHLYIINSTRPDSSHYMQNGFGMYPSIHEGFRYNAFLSCCTYQNTANNGLGLHIDCNTLLYINRSTYTFSGYGNIDEKNLYPMAFAGISYSGQANTFGIGGPINYITPMFRDGSSILMGYPEGLYWLGRSVPYATETVINRDGEVCMALQIYCNGYWCQAIFKMVDLYE